MARSDFWFFFPFRVRYAEVDQQGVVFNACYLTYFDTAITEYMRALPYDYLGQVKATGTDFHIVKAVVEYKAPIRFDQQIEVGVRTARLGRSSMTFALEIFDKDQAEPLSLGEVVWVNADQKVHKPVPVGEALRALLTAREGAKIATV
jgi:acyl-CoA thioester hydrolase